MKRPTVKREMERLGFAIEETGGGCTAYTKYESNGDHIMITLATDPTAPTNRMDPVIVGKYNDKGEMIYQDTFDTLQEYVDFVGGNDLQTRIMRDLIQDSEPSK